MSSFSIPKAAFAGFGLMARKPLALVVWIILGVGYLTLYMALGTILSGEAFAVLAELQEQARQGNPNPTTMMQVVGQTQLWSAAGIPLRILVTVVLAAAVVRGLLRPSDKGLAYLKLGGDELRAAVPMIVIFVITLLVIVAGALLAVVLGLVGTGVGGMMDARRPAAFIGAGIGGVVTVALATFITVKFCLAVPQTIAERQIRIFETWGMTKGHFWRILGAYLLALLALAPIVAATTGGAMAAALSLGEVQGWQQAFQFLSVPAYTTADLFTPARLAIYVLTGLSFTLVMVVVMSVPASIYGQLTDFVDPATVDDIDDEDWDDED